MGKKGGREMDAEATEEEQALAALSVTANPQRSETTYKKGIHLRFSIKAPKKFL